MAEWLKAADCKSVHVCVRRFESYSSQFNCGTIAQMVICRRMKYVDINMIFLRKEHYSYVRKFICGLV